MKHPIRYVPIAAAVAITVSWLAPRTMAESQTAVDSASKIAPAGVTVSQQTDGARVIHAPAMVGRASQTDNDVVYRSAARGLRVTTFDAPRNTTNRSTTVWRATPSSVQSARIISASQGARTADYTVARFTEPAQTQATIVNANVSSVPQEITAKPVSQATTVNQMYVTGLESGKPTPVQYGQATPVNETSTGTTQPYISGPVSVPQPQPAPQTEQKLYYPTGTYNHPTVVKKEVVHHYYPAPAPTTVVYHRPYYYPRPVVYCPPPRVAYCPPRPAYRSSFFFSYGHSRGYGHYRHYSRYRGHGRHYGRGGSRVGFSISFGKRW